MVVERGARERTPGRYQPRRPSESVLYRSTARAMQINTINLLILTAAIPVAGWISDRIGRKPVLLGGMAAMILLSWPLFWMMNQATSAGIFLGQLGFALIIAWIWGVNPAAQSEILPRNVRISAFSIAYSLCLALFGGTTPLVAAYLLRRSADDFAPVWYLIGLSVVSLLAVWSIPETRPGIAGTGSSRDARRSA